jgi:transcription termination factor NusB
MDENDRRRALLTLQKVYEDLARRAVDTVLENEEGLEQSPYSFAYQEIEDRFAPRLINLGHMIGALQHAGRQQRQPHTEFRVERVAGKLEELDGLINEKLREWSNDALHQVSVVSDASTGQWHAFLTMSRTS